MDTLDSLSMEDAPRKSARKESKVGNFLESVISALALQGGGAGAVQERSQMRRRKALSSRLAEATWQDEGAIEGLLDAGARPGLDDLQTVEASPEIAATLGVQPGQKIPLREARQSASILSQEKRAALAEAGRARLEEKRSLARQYIAQLNVAAADSRKRAEIASQARIVAERTDDDNLRKAFLDYADLVEVGQNADFIFEERGLAGQGAEFLGLLSRNVKAIPAKGSVTKKAAAGTDDNPAGLNFGGK